MAEAVAVVSVEVGQAAALVDPEASAEDPADSEDIPPEPILAAIPWAVAGAGGEALLAAVAAWAI